MTPEAKLSAEIRLALGREKDLVLWRNHTGAAEVRGHWQKFGLCVGSSDLVGILGPLGRFFGLEIKTPKGRLSEDQRLFAALVRRLGGFCSVARSVEEGRAALDRARRGEVE